MKNAKQSSLLNQTLLSLLLLSLFLFAIITTACSSALVIIDLDTDGDGLMDSMEAEYGTDPLNIDSDLDSYTDFQEIEQGTNPLDPADHPYAGGWTIDVDCRDTVVSTGNDVGEVMEHFEAVDQFGETVSSYDFCNRTLLLAAGAFW